MLVERGVCVTVRVCVVVPVVVMVGVGSGVGGSTPQPYRRFRHRAEGATLGELIRAGRTGPEGAQGVTELDRRSVIDHEPLRTART